MNKWDGQIEILILIFALYLGNVCDRTRGLINLRILYEDAGGLITSIALTNAVHAGVYDQ